MRYRATDLEPVPVGRNALLAYSRAGDEPFLLSMAEAQLLFLCATPRSIEDHVAACARTVGPAHLQSLAAALNPGAAYGLVPPAVAIAERLRHLADRGALRPEGPGVGCIDPKDAGVLPDDRPATIASIGIPTRDRPEALHRAVTSYLAHARTHDRAPDLVVCDDSQTEGMRDRSWNVLGSASKGAEGSIRYIPRERRAAFARLLGRKADVPAEVVEFALLGDPRFGGSYGAARNALLLETVGEATLQADDDTVCTALRLRERERGVTMTARADPSDYWFLGAESEADAVVEESDVDLLGAHGAVLGRSIPAILRSAAEAGEPVAWGESSPAFARAVSDPGARVLLSFAGTVGDVGGPGRHHWRMVLDGPSLARLTADRAGFTGKLRSRQIVRAPTRLSITVCGFCITPHLALDQRTLLPPFPPVLVGEDVAFGAAVAAMHPTACSAFLPLGVRHAPLMPRPDPVELVPPSHPANAILHLLITHAATSWPATDPETRLRRIGAYLSDLGRTGRAGFRGHVRMVAYTAIGAGSRAMEAQIALRADAPAFWRERAEADCRNAQRMLLEEDPASPVDLPGSPSEREALFQSLVGRYGELLTSWGDLVAATLELRARGVRMSVPRAS